MAIHMDHNYAHFIPQKARAGNRLCHQDKSFDKHASMDYSAVTCKKCLKIYDNAQEEAIMQAEALAS